MGHIDYKSESGSVSSPEWLGVASQVGSLVNEIAGRNDLVGLAGPDAGGGAPACYKPSIAEVELNTVVAFGAGADPRYVGDLCERSTQYEFPVATGAIYHEAFHARFSGWSIPAAAEALKEDELEALILLEESRIERRGIVSNPLSRVFLKASAISIAVGDVEQVKSLTTTRLLANVVALVHGRVLAGVLDLDDVAQVIASTNEKLGDDVVRKLSEILSKFQEHTNDSDLSDVYDLAREWAKIVRETEEERGESSGDGQEQEDGTEGAAAEAAAALASELLGELREAADDVAVSNHSDLVSQEVKEEWDKEVKERAKESKERKSHKESAKEVFSKGTGPLPASPTASRLVESRKPNASERSAAVIVSRLLEKAKYRERDAVDVSSVVPPGRLRTRALVQGAAMKAKGIATPVEAFRRTVRKQTDDPTLTVGVMVDISGSMSSAMEPMATTAWVLSEAVKRVQGRAAMVYFGSDVFPTLKAGQHLDDVQVYSAPDGTEKFHRAFTALNGELDLLYGSGARLLVVVSDGCYTGKEAQAATEWVAR